MLRRTKIIATLGPACSTPEILHAMIKAGLDVLRINFSHASDSVIETIKQARLYAESIQKPLAIMGDLQGPKIRVGRMQDAAIQLRNGHKITLRCDEAVFLGTEQCIPVLYTSLCHEIKAGDRLLLDDGLIELMVDEIHAPMIECVVIEGGILRDNKGINRKGGGLAARALTQKDLEDIKLAVKMGVDYLALSFVKDAEDIHHARTLLAQLNAEHISIIAKIERSEALEQLTEIIKTTDVIMVARGDLGVEVGAAELPAIQKHIISETRRHHKVVITATQMMESMINQAQPTRAEVSDVANAILDGTDAVMLSAETAKGLYPLQVINMVDKICRSAEKHSHLSFDFIEEAYNFECADRAIAIATMHAANHFPVQAIIALTESGRSALWMSRQHSNVPIYAITTNHKTVNKLSLINNVFPILFDFHSIPKEEINQAVLTLMQKLNLISPSSYVLLTRGQTIGEAGGTNRLEVLYL